MARTFRSQQQLHHDRVNATRMVERLDETTKHLGAGKGKERASLNEGALANAADDVTLDYWQLKALQTSLRHARTLLDDLPPGDSHTTSVADMQNRLRKAEERVKVALGDTHPPASAAAATTGFRFSAPAPPAFPPPTSLPSSSPPAPAALIPLSEEESSLLSRADPFPEGARPRTHPEDGDEVFPKPRLPPPPPKAQTDNVEKVLSSQRNTQEELTSELSTMASQLRKNAEHFGTLLAKDRAVIESAADSLDGNLGRMQKEGGRLGKYSARARGTTCWTILAVAMVGVAWTVMFIIIRVT